MSSPKGVQEFGRQLDKMVGYFVAEFDMSVAELVGTLEVTKFNLMNYVADELDSEEREGPCGGFIDE